VLILDEINRTDLSRLIGEMFSLIEDRQALVDLPGLDEHGNKRTVQLPEDLFFIGTMNLIDQSVEQLDFALRRRFLWLHSGFRAEVIPQVVQQRWDAYGLGHHPWERLRREIELLAERAKMPTRNSRLPPAR
jgi:5-methylcytosine-specific restriction protein B